MEQILRDAIEAVHAPSDWVHLATTRADGSPHVTPMMMALHEDGLLFSMTGQQKKRNVERDPRACVAISKPVSMAHVIVWGTLVMRHDEQAQEIWEAMIRNAFGEEGLGQRARKLSLERTSLGVLTPSHHRIYGLD